jgi:hypothetical protein
MPLQFDIAHFVSKNHPIYRSLKYSSHEAGQELLDSVVNH